MRLLFNIVWWVLFGWLVALVFYALGVVLTLLDITAPIGLGLMQYGKFLLAPFSMEMVSEAKFQLDADKNSAWKAYSGIVMIVYVLCADIWLALGVALSAFAQAITVVGLPNAYVLAKSLGTVFNPVGKRCVSKTVSDELKRRAASQKVDEMTR